MTEIEKLPVLPLSDTVVLPGMVIPVELNDNEVQAAVDTAQTGTESRLLLVPRLGDEYASVGATASVEQLGRLPSGEPAVLVRAHARATIGTSVAGSGEDESGAPGPDEDEPGVGGSSAALWVEAQEIEPTVSDADRALELASEYKSLVTSILQQRNAWQMIDSVQKLSDPGQLADTAGWAGYLTQDQKIQLLTDPDACTRLESLVGWTKEHLAEQEVADQISQDVKEGMEKTQREFLLRQQLAAIRSELGEGETEGADDYRSRVEEADLPDEVTKAALTEVSKLEQASEQSPESGWIRTWLDTILEVPWKTRTTDSNELAHTREILDADHSGLDDVKKRLVEFLAVRQRRNRRGLDTIGGRGSGAVLSLVGPPGVGKTSLGESVARSLGRNFVRVSLGGVRDEAEIRGHRRTYVGAMAGRIVRAITEAGSMNPVVLLDEIDKVGADFRGDPAAALLEVLDPAQNHTFRDHYLEVDLDLSDVLFLTTANVTDTIPQALLDRMEIVSLDGYTEDEKIAIARDHLVPDQITKAGLEPSDVEITDDSLGTIAREHTREPGVRQLQRSISKVLRKVTVELDSTESLAGDRRNPTGQTAVPDTGSPDGIQQSGTERPEIDSQETASPEPATDHSGQDHAERADSDHDAPAHTADTADTADNTAAAGHHAPADEGRTVIITPDNLTDYLGRPRFTPESAERTETPGVATGLAVTDAGGEVLFVEASEMDGESGLILTGQLGDVMKESAEIGLSYLRSRGQAAHLADHRVHLHVPTGAVPKDGPSAGITMVTALASLASGRLVKSTVGMTGELTLQGKVLPIGGVKQKLLAAHRAGLTDVIIPQRNEPDLDDVPDAVRQALTVHPAGDIADVLALALEGAEPDEFVPQAGRQTLAA